MPDHPKHIGLIVDGNRRWARSRNLPAVKGYDKGKDVLLELIETAFDMGVQEISAWLFSTENWKRDESEVSYLMNLIPGGFKLILPIAHRYEARITHYGRKDRMPARFQGTVTEAEAETGHYTKRRINLCLDHGGQDEITRAVQSIVAAGIPAHEITPDVIRQHLDSKDSLPLDLIIRTGGDIRTSGFLLWLSAYSELDFEDISFPDLTPERLQAILSGFAGRERRFGGNAAATSA